MDLTRDCSHADVMYLSNMQCIVMIVISFCSQGWVLVGFPSTREEVCVCACVCTYTPQEFNDDCLRQCVPLPAPVGTCLASNWSRNGQALWYDAVLCGCVC